VDSSFLPYRAAPITSDEVSLIEPPRKSEVMSLDKHAVNRRCAGRAVPPFPPSSLASEKNKVSGQSKPALDKSLVGFAVDTDERGGKLEDGGKVSEIF